MRRNLIERFMQLMQLMQPMQFNLVGSMVNFLCVRFVSIAAIIFICWAANVPCSAAAKISAPPILLVNVLGPDIDVTQYLVSEKYDGVRAIWNGKVLRFRSGRVVNAPTWFIAKLPPHKLDGELWLAREKFKQLSGVVRKTEPLDDEWRPLSYMIFELPDAAGTFAERAVRIREIVDAAKWPQLVAVT